MQNKNFANLMECEVFYIDYLQKMFMALLIILWKLP